MVPQTGEDKTPSEPLQHLLQWLEVSKKASETTVAFLHLGGGGRVGMNKPSRKLGDICCSE